MVGHALNMELNIQGKFKSDRRLVGFYNLNFNCFKASGKQFVFGRVRQRRMENVKLSP